MSSTGTATRVLADFVVGAQPADLPPAVRRQAAFALLDCLGTMLAGSQEPAGAIPARVLAGIEAGGAASIVGTTQAVSPPSAALVNGASAHALDFDDVHFPWYGHPTTVLLPAVLAVAEQRGQSGARLLTAYAVGLTVGHALGSTFNLTHYERGWHATATFGSIAAAAACAYLIDLPAALTAHALGIAASKASGLRQNFGSMTKPLHAGLGARNGVLAALLAEGGLTADAAALEGPYGFGALLAGGPDPTLPDLLAESLASGFVPTFAGLSVKQYPSCAATHPALDGLLHLVQQHQLTPDAVAQIDVDSHSLVPELLIHPRARTGLEGKFSMPYCMAVALQDRAAGLPQFTDERAADPALAALMERVALRVDPAIPTDGNFATRVTATLADGQQVSTFVPQARGTPTRPLAEYDLVRKFHGCASLCLTPAAVDEVLRAMVGCDDLSDVRQLTHALRAGLRSAPGADSLPAASAR